MKKSKLKNKNANSLMMSPFELFAAFFVILIIFIAFFALFKFDNDQKLIIKQTEKKVGDNIFLIGLLKSEVSSGNSVFDEISSYHINKDQNQKIRIKDHISKTMFELYGMDYCWDLRINNKIIIEFDTNCDPMVDTIKANIVVPSKAFTTFEIRFDT